MAFKLFDRQASAPVGDDMLTSDRCIVHANPGRRVYDPKHTMKHHNELQCKVEASLTRAPANDAFPYTV